MRKRFLFLVFILISKQPMAHQTGHPFDIPEIIQLPRDQTIQLSDVIKAAFDLHPQRLILESQHNETNALQSLSKSWLADETALTLRMQSDQFGSQKGLQEFEVAYEVPLWLPTQRAAWQRVADAAQQESTFASQALLHIMAGDVREILWKIAQQETLVTLAEHEWDLAIHLGNQLQRRLEVGEIATRDIVLAQEEILRKQAEFQQAEQELVILYNHYKSLTGLEKLPSNFEETLNENALKNFKETDLSWHPLIQAAQRKIQRADAELHQLRSALTSPPILSFSMRRERAQAQENYQDSVGLNVRIPFGHHGQQSVKLAAAHRRRAENYADLQKIFRDTQLAIKNAEYTYQNAQHNLKTIELQKKLADENLRLARLALQHGEMDLIDFQKIQSLAFTAERAVHQRQLAVKLAIARYHQALGLLPEGTVYE